MVDTNMNNKKVLFLSEACVLDPNSGAAIEMLGWLNILAGNGYQCFSSCLSIFDGEMEFPIQEDIFPDVVLSENVGNRIRTFVNNVEHNVFYAGSSVGSKISREKIDAFIKSAAEDIQRIKPDVVLGYGGPNLVALRRLAKKLGAKTAFNLHNASYEKEKQNSFGEIDKIFTPSGALKNLYEDRFGFKNISVVHNRVRRFIPKSTLKNQYLLERRKKGFVTIINPSILKGCAIFLQIANQSKVESPKTVFLAVESRADQSSIEGSIKGASRLNNIWWVQRQKNMQQLYERVSVLLVPSIYFEAAGRVIIEAQMAGIPVLATDNGGIPETLNGAGSLFPIPESILANAYSVPKGPEVKEWVNKIVKLMDNDKYYVASCKAALKASGKFDEENVDREIIDAVDSLCYT
jgi:glycosyltransferase involved in cell wall biosynthesis